MAFGPGLIIKGGKYKNMAFELKDVMTNAIFLPVLFWAIVSSPSLTGLFY